MSLTERERASLRRDILEHLPAGASLTSKLVIRDLLEGFKPFASFDRNGLSCDISFTCPGHPAWSSELAASVLDLTRQNMRALYEAAAGWGWKEGDKRAELLHPDNRYLVARARGGASAPAPAAAAAAAASDSVPAAAGGGAASSDACTAGELLGFVSFRFLPEGDFDLLYVYELQTGPKAQRKGLGKHLMQMCELIARKYGMQG
jgi:ribosomal protein S18 acetylase RimI-like enzyme